MSKLHELGDIHFSNADPAHFNAGENFIKWFESHDFGPREETELGLAGDIAEKAENPGNIVSQMYRFFEIASKKFKHIYVTVGNHDRKLNYGTDTNSLVFLPNAFSNVTVVDKESVITTENGFKVLFLPWQRMQKFTLSDYYNNHLPEEIMSDTYDAIFMHWNIIDNSDNWMMDGVDISKFHTKSWAIGHVHTRNREEYLGSVYPNAKNEQETKFHRGYRTIDSDGNVTWTDMPEFLRVVKFDFNEEPPKETLENCEYTYIVTNCDNLSEAKQKFPDITVRSIERTITSMKEQKDEIQVEATASSFIDDLGSAFDDMIKENNLTVDTGTYRMIKAAL